MVLHFSYSYREFIFLPVIDRISKNIFGRDCPNVKELEQKTQIALVSTHPAMDYVEPLPPNVIPITGLQIVDPKPLSNVSNEMLKLCCVLLHWEEKLTFCRTLTTSSAQEKKDPFCFHWEQTSKAKIWVWKSRNPLWKLSNNCLSTISYGNSKMKRYRLNVQRMWWLRSGCHRTAYWTIRMLKHS